MSRSFTFDEATTVTLDLGASTSLDANGFVTVPLNVPLAEFDRVWLARVICKVPSSPKLRLRVRGSGVHAVDQVCGGVLATADNFPANALYVAVPAPVAADTVVHDLAVPLCWFYSSGVGHQQARIERLELEVRTWGGAAITYTDLALQLLVTRRDKLRQVYGTDNRIITGADELRGAGRN